jgi:hypothetical protein
MKKGVHTEVMVLRCMYIEWIKSCDTKTSIVLGVIGIFLTIFASDSSINMLNLVFSMMYKILCKAFC